VFDGSGIRLVQLSRILNPMKNACCHRVKEGKLDGYKEQIFIEKLVPEKVRDNVVPTSFDGSLDTRRPQTK
jgi:hypothetical protein